MSKGPIPVYANGRYWPSFKQALIANDLLSHTNSSQRTAIRKELRGGWTVRVYGVQITPADRVLKFPEETN